MKLERDGMEMHTYWTMVRSCWDDTSQKKVMMARLAHQPRLKLESGIFCVSWGEVMIVESVDCSCRWRVGVDDWDIVGEEGQGNEGDRALEGLWGRTARLSKRVMVTNVDKNILSNDAKVYAWREKEKRRERVGVGGEPQHFILTVSSHGRKSSSHAGKDGWHGRVCNDDEVRRKVVMAALDSSSPAARMEEERCSNAFC